LARKRTTVPTKPNDARARRSVEAMRAAFLELIEIKPLDDILLRDITDAAGLSYATFFRRFASKEDLLIDIARGEVRNLMELSRQAILNKTSEGGKGMCEYVQNRRNLWKGLLTGGATSAMREEFIRAAQHMVDVRGRVNPAIPLDLAAGFTASGIFEIFAWWMRQPDDYPVGNVNKMFDALIVNAIGRPLDLALD